MHLHVFAEFHSPAWLAAPDNKTINSNKIVNSGVLEKISDSLMDFLYRYNHRVTTLTHLMKE